jgi:hypothetical protein
MNGSRGLRYPAAAIKATWIACRKSAAGLREICKYKQEGGFMTALLEYIMKYRYVST